MDSYLFWASSIYSSGMPKAEFMYPVFLLLMTPQSAPSSYWVVNR